MKKTLLILTFLISVIAIAASFTPYQPPLFKNLKVLPKNISKEAMDSTMEHFSRSLGVTCGFCHVHNKLRDTWDMASDANAEKLITRKMMLMTNGINAKYFPAEKGVKKEHAIETITCYTCHKGEAIPVSDKLIGEEKEIK